jgi:hypothetical protein
LSEFLLECRSVGHGKPGPIDQQGPVTSPQAVSEGRQASGKPGQQIVEDLKGQPVPGLVVRLPGALHATQMRDMGTGRVPMQNLEEKQMDRSGWIKNPLPPRMTNPATGGPDEIWGQNAGDI